VVPDPLSGHGPSVRLSERRGQRGKESPGMGSGAPPFPAICKNGSTCPVPYGVGATVSDILI